MTDCISKMLILYFILITMLFIAKPRQFYYDTDKTRLKPLGLYVYTQNPNDLITFHSSSIFIAIITYLLVSSLQDN